MPRRRNILLHPARLCREARLEHCLLLWQLRLDITVRLMRQCDFHHRSTSDPALSLLKVAVAGSLPTAYSNAKLGKKDLCLGCVLVSRGGSFVCCFDVTVGYQAIKRLFFGCARIFGPFFNAPAAHDVTQDRKFFVVYADGLCHLNAPMSPRTSTSMLV
jgi:hypothetical protein